jgi:hypothetical protein
MRGIETGDIREVNGHSSAAAAAAAIGASTDSADRSGAGKVREIEADRSSRAAGRSGAAIGPDLSVQD